VLPGAAVAPAPDKSKEASALVRPPWSPESSTGAPNIGRTWMCWSGARGGHEDDPRAGAPCYEDRLRDLGCSAWRREGAGVT